MLAALLAQQHDETHRGSKQDELLAHRVHTAVVERDRGDHIGRLALGDRYVAEQHPVGAAELTEGGQTSESVDQHRCQQPRRYGKHRQARAPAHSSARLRRSSRSFARVSRTITGSATPPTTICESATSGA